MTRNGRSIRSAEAIADVIFIFNAKQIHKKERTIAPMKYCTKCGASATDEQKFCVSCGEPLIDQAAAKNLESSPMPIYDSYAPKVTTKMEFVNLPEKSPSRPSRLPAESFAI